MKSQVVKNKIQVYFLALLLMLALSTIFLNSFYWPYQEISKRKILVAIIVFFGVVVVPILIITINDLYRFVEDVIKVVANVVKDLGKNKKKVMFFVILALLTLAFSWIITSVVSNYILRNEYNVRLFYLCVTIIALVLVFAFMWKQATKKIENVFLIVALTLGLFCIGVTPDKVGVSWDDQIHYERTLEISNFLNGIMYKADEKNIEVYVYLNTMGYDRETDYEYVEDMESSYAAKEFSLHEFSEYGVWSVSYIPGVIGIILGRGLGLSYTGVFNMGRFFNLLTYCMLIYFAIKRLKYGKVLVATVGLIPSTLFMASCYTYDSWVTGFTVLGFAYFFAELQEDSPVQTKNMLIMIGSIVIGCLVKAIYFPILFPLLFIPKNKFKNSRQRKIYYSVIIGGGLFLVGTFLLPMLINGAGTGDVRGGLEVNSTEQIKFILANPLAYAKILVEFLKNYISLGSSAPMLQFYAYAGNGSFYSIVSIMLVVLAFLDRGEREQNYNIIRVTGLIGCIVAIALASTALYISFTAVASETIAGMQGRYLIPTIFPALYAIGSGGITHKYNKNACVCVPMIIIAITFIYNLGSFCVINY